jgi:hypothetical protein
MEALMAYLDSGGKLYLSSMDLLSSISPPNAFVSNYLGVSSWTVNTRSDRAVGLPGDPISDGMDMALTWPQQTANRVDTVNPGTGAATIFNSHLGASAAVRFDSMERDGFRTVFNTIAQNAFPTAGADPNNNNAVIGKILEWLLQSDPSAVEPAGAFAGSLQTGPNPARGSAEIRFALGEAGGPVQLDLVDVAGRRVRGLVNGRMAAGPHQVAWDCTDDSGRPVPTGCYFARLETSAGASTSRIVVLR